MLDLILTMALTRFRPAAFSDAASIASLHADNWQRHYRGAYSDEYLDGDVLDDRRAVWSERLGKNCDDSYTIVAERAEQLVGFAHTRLDSDPEWGALLDNLHVRYDLKRQGMGGALMRQTALVLLVRRPMSGLYLWVLKQNTAAQAFYSAQGGAVVEERLRGPLPGGGRAPVFRYAWPDPAVLVGSGGQLRPH